MERKFLIVADNPESENFRYIDELTKIYKIDYVTNEEAYRENFNKKNYDAAIITNLNPSIYPGKQWRNRFIVIMETLENRVPVIAFSSGSDKINRLARSLGAVLIEPPAEPGAIVKELEKLNIKN